MTHPIYIAEFDEDFMTYYRQFCGAAPIELMSEPKIFLHDPQYPCNNLVFIAAAEEQEKLPVKVLDVSYTYNTSLATTQLTLALQTTVDKDGFIPYAVLMNDPYQNQASRRYTRSITSAIIDIPNGFHIRPFVAPPEIAVTIIRAYTPLSKGHWE